MGFWNRRRQPEPEPAVKQGSVEQALAATVEVRVSEGLGSGFLVDPAGLVVTARHVVDDGRRSLRRVTVRVFPNEAREQKTSATVFRSHRRLDYALLWLDHPVDHPVMELGRPADLRHTDVVFALGSPSGLAQTVSRGIVSNPRAVMGGVEYIQTDAAISGGNSGGPLVDDAGRVLGINLMGLSDAHGNVDAAHFALPIDYILDDIKDACRRGNEACRNGFYCRSCGSIQFGREAWYCRTCGLALIVATADAKAV